MSVLALKRKNPAETQPRAQRGMYHASMLVTRAEEWCVEASSAEEARALLAAGEGHRCHLGDCLHIELEDLLDS
jgi:hypothetical protein